jgi:hypothetical protein
MYLNSQQALNICLFYQTERNHRGLPAATYYSFQTDDALGHAVADIYELRGWPCMIVDGVPLMYMRAPRWGQDDWRCLGSRADELKEAWQGACDRYFDELADILQTRGLGRVNGPCPF